LLHAEPNRGASNVTLLGDGDEVAEVTKFRGWSYTKNMVSMEF
jgi:hypothetical protein